MNITEIKTKLQQPEYNFLNENPKLGDNIMLLGLGGSHAYGLDTPTSDLDVRGIAANSADSIIIGDCFEQIVDEPTDTTIYSLDKILHLLSNCNPNTIELLGLKPEHYLQLNGYGQLLLDNKDAFLSKIAIHSFGGYATSQLRRLENKTIRDMDQSRREEHIMNSIKNAMYDYKNRYFYMPDDSVKLYVDKAVNEGMDTEIFMDINLKHYPLRDYRSMWSEMHDIVKQYNTIGARNSKAIEHSKLAKHMCHLVRLYLMCFDILENGEIITYREKDHDLLMNIRNGGYLDDNGKANAEFYEMVDELESKLEYWKQHTPLPDKPDYNRIRKLHGEINTDIVLEHYSAWR